MNAWATLETELDAWAETGRTAQVWWRDDDAAAATPAFERLLQLAAGTGAPLALAVIPASAEPALARQVADQPADVTVLQHGFAHADHAPAAAKKCELVSPAARPAGIDELCQGPERLRRLSAQRFRPVLVPPWNRIAHDLLARLPAPRLGRPPTYHARAAPPPRPPFSPPDPHPPTRKPQPPAPNP